jgi:hypothetical protein
MDLRFPFLIVEAKACATGGNLYQAQNQAAVSGSAALQILKSVSDLQHTTELDQEDQDNMEVSNQPDQPRAPNLVFSITTEGPVHELWVHFQGSSDDFHMVCVRAWRITIKDDVIDFLHHLSAVLRWGNSEFRDMIVHSL